MPKIKTNKSAVKRFKVSATGKLMRRHAYNNHLFLPKRGSRKRRLDLSEELFKGERKRVVRMLGGLKHL